MEDNTDSAKRSKNFSKQELEVLVEEVFAQSVSAVWGMERDAVTIKKKGRREITSEEESS
ncbi:hypothetical protein N1851_020064 [Merluccius polli]|uniref:Uncharacterized protein n=1 Tax=Merluccius polli TaxID=89951 RepID=A0AA47NZ73_MERPO|nr:hypothetical protein N1851_020064 [Merluccius polli]